MGLATIDPHSLKEHTEIHKIPKFGVNRPTRPWESSVRDFVCSLATVACVSNKLCQEAAAMLPFLIKIGEIKVRNTSKYLGNYLFF